METRTIELSLETAKRWYEQGGELKEMALGAFDEKELIGRRLPKTWEEFCETYTVITGECYISPDSLVIPYLSKEKNNRDFLLDRTFLPSRQAGCQHLALMQLHQLRDCYRQGWVSDWKNGEEKYCVEHFSYGYDMDYSETAPYFLAFQSEWVAKEFLHNFYNLIEEAGDLI